MPIPHLHSTPPSRGSHRNNDTPFDMEKLEWCGYPMVKKFRRYAYSFWHDPRTWVTDGRTDTDEHRMTAIAVLMHSIVWQKISKIGLFWYKLFLEIGRLDRALILLHLAVYLLTASVSSVFMVLYMFKIFGYILFFTCLCAGPGGISRWLVNWPLSYDTVCWLVWQAKSSLKWSVCWVGC